MKSLVLAPLVFAWHMQSIDQIPDLTFYTEISRPEASRGGDGLPEAIESQIWALKFLGPLLALQWCLGWGCASFKLKVRPHMDV